LKKNFDPEFKEFCDIWSGRYWNSFSPS